eukprot:TRINITY_DN23604_c0_g1_i1.p1 TRINITY_DN23604_c0_g1~~TRINITY_DN23604_c0_g1_i1.p1  ORF type:complete len:677 (+),score=176.49 TRINITY_DN23604_c0_g1_i1:138-2168(+)
MSMRCAALAAALVLWPACVTGSQGKGMNMPASVLTDDDPCLDDLSGEHTECGTALVQSAMERHRTAKKTLHRVKSNAAMPKEVKGPVLLLDAVRQVVTKESSTSLQEAKSLLAEHAALLEAEAASTLSEASEKHQNLLKAHVASFAQCDTDLHGRMDMGQKLQAIHSGWTRLHEGCHGQEQKLSELVDGCKLHLTASKDGTHGAELSGCQEEKALLETKRSECQSLLQSVRTAYCARASQVSGICDMYDLCRAGMSMAYASAKGAAISWEGSHATDLRAVATLQCFTQSLIETDSDGVLLKLDDCEQKARNTSFFQLDYPEPPQPLACSAESPGDSSCLEEISAARDAQVEKKLAATKTTAEAVIADLSSEVVGGVSLMQEGLERATVELPKEINQAFLGPLATPVSMLVALVTVLGLMARCMLYQEGKRQRASQETKASSPLPVNAWCISSQEAAAASDAASLQSDGSWLCYELVVPRQSKCTVSTARIVIGEGGLPWSSVVTDKLGQPLFRATLADAKDSEAEVLTLSRQDGTVLARCQVTLPKAKGKRHGTCDILDRCGGLFATLEWDHGKASWFSWLSSSKKREPGSFILKAAKSTKGWQLRPGSGGDDPLLSILDASRRPVAEVEQSRAGDSGESGLETLRIDVNNSSDTDLGLVTAAVLIADRLQAISKG